MVGPFTWLDLIIVAAVIIVGIIGFIKGFFKQILDIVGLVGALILALLLCGPLAKLITPLFGKLVEDVGQDLGNIAITAIAFVFICLVVGIVMIFLKRLFKGINKVPIIGPINRILGVVLSVFILYAIVSIVLGLVGLVPAEMYEETGFGIQIHNGIITKGLFNANWLGNIVGGVVSKIIPSLG